MPYVTSAERFGIEKGLQQGMQQGMQQGIRQGEAAILRRMLARRFGALPDSVLARLNSASTEELEAWSLNILDAASLSEVFGPC